MADIRSLKELDKVLADNPKLELKSTWIAGVNKFGRSYWLYDEENCSMVTVDGRAAAAYNRRNK
jgi:hypothetical protein